jgi:hypothetical protein
LPQVMVGIYNKNNLDLLENVFGVRGEKYAVSLAKAVEVTATCIDRRRREHGALVEFLAGYDN